MGVARFEQGRNVELEGRTFHLLRKVTEDLWQLEDVRTKRVQEVTDSFLRQRYATGKLRFISKEQGHSHSTDGKKQREHRDIPEQAWEQAKVRRAYVLAVLALPSTKQAILPVINEVWQSLNTSEKAPSATSVLRWKAAYIAADRSIHALVDNMHKKGNRKPRYPSDVQGLVEQAVEVTYLTRERKTVKDTLDKAKYLVIKENEHRPSTLMLPMPSRRLVQRVINGVPAFDRCVARFGKVSATKRFRAVMGHRMTDAPLERAEIDHTKLDIFVIDDRSGLPLGRPWLTACIDDYSRCILGVHLGFEPPSYLTVANCLKHAFLPKPDLKRQFKDIKNEWTAHGIMRELVVDNGKEFHSSSLENACLELGIEIHYSPRKTPWFKGKIERWFGSINRGVAHGNPGTSFSNIFEKDDYNPEKHAVVRLSVLREMVMTWIVDYYHQVPHRSLDAAPDQVWKNGIAPEDILVPVDPDLLVIALGRREERVLTHKGIELDGLTYNSPELRDLRHQYGEQLKVEVRADDTDLGRIAVISPSKTRHEAKANAFQYANGLTRWQHRIFKRYAADKLKSYDSSGWLKAKEHISELVQNELANKRRSAGARIARFSTTGKSAHGNSHATEDSSVTAIEDVSVDPLEESSDDSMSQLGMSECNRHNRPDDPAPAVSTPSVTRRYSVHYSERGRMSPFGAEEEKKDD